MDLLLTVLSARKVTLGANAGATLKGQHQEESRGAQNNISSISPPQGGHWRPGRKGTSLTFPGPFGENLPGLVPVYSADCKDLPWALARLPALGGVCCARRRGGGLKTQTLRRRDSRPLRAPQREPDCKPVASAEGAAERPNLAEHPANYQSCRTSFSDHPAAVQALISPLQFLYSGI